MLGVSVFVYTGCHPHQNKDWFCWMPCVWGLCHSFLLAVTHTKTKTGFVGCHVCGMSLSLFFIGCHVRWVFSSLLLLDARCSFYIFFKNLVLINWMEWSMIPACPSLMCSFKGLTLWKFVSDVCACMFYVCEMISFVDGHDRGLIYTSEEFRSVYLLMMWVWLSWGNPVWFTGC